MTQFEGYLPSIVREARAWAKDCQWADADNDMLDSMSDEQIMRGIERHFEGGIQAFLDTL